MNDSLQQIYAVIPELQCQGKCQESCGPILMSSTELTRIAAITKPPSFCSITLTCTKLKGGRCSIYELRPLICRLWGVVKAMACPHGCNPARWLSDSEARSLIKRANALCGVPETRGSENL